MAKNPEHRDLFPGALEVMILQSLRLKPMHGYALVKHIKQVSDNLLQVEEGSLYPALQRMLREGWLESEIGTSAKGAPPGFIGLPMRAFAIWNRKSSASRRCSPASPVCSPSPRRRRSTDARFKSLFGRRRRYDDLSVSIQEHIEERTEELMEEGMPRKQAEQTARREFGNVTLIRNAAAKCGSGGSGIHAGRPEI